jgi:hypothetical protein|tara:strand:+ start:226 stop:504 length:279 start_codon:yes stop_codon:yes gene_type:complete
MKLSKDFIKELILEQLSVVPDPEDRRQQLADMLKVRSEELDSVSSSLTDMGKYFQGVYPDFDSDLTEIIGSIGDLMEKIEDKTKELENENTR